MWAVDLKFIPPCLNVECPPPPGHNDPLVVGNGTRLAWRLRLATREVWQDKGEALSVTVISDHLGEGALRSHRPCRIQPASAYTGESPA